MAEVRTLIFEFTQEVLFLKLKKTVLSTCHLGHARKKSTVI